MSEEDQDTAAERSVVGPDDDPVAALNRHSASHPFVTELGLEVEAYEDGQLRARVPHHEHYANPGMGGTLHGGIVTSMLDTVMGYTVMAALGDDPLAYSGPTININVNFIGAVRDEVEAIGEVVRVGSSTAVIEGRLRDPDSGEVLASSEGVWRVYQGDG